MNIGIWRFSLHLLLAPASALPSQFWTPIRRGSNKAEIFLHMSRFICHLHNLFAIFSAQSDNIPVEIIDNEVFIRVNVGVILGIAY